MKVLIIDDDLASIEIIRIELSSALDDLMITTCQRFDELHDLDLKLFDVILLDYNLGTHDATEVLEYIGELKIDTTIVIITGYLDERSLVRLLQQGADAYVLKDRLYELPKTVIDLFNQDIREKQLLDNIQKVLDGLTNKIDTLTKSLNNSDNTEC